jgi:hypothetical protein
MGDSWSDEVANHDDHPVLDASGSRGRSKRSRGLAIGVSATVAIVAVAVIVLVGGTPGAIPSAAAAATVQRAVAGAVTSGSADFTVVEHVSVAGQQVTLNAAGGCAFARAMCAMTTTLSGSPAVSQLGTFTEREVDNQVYLKFGPRLAARLPTPWVSVPFDATKIREAAGGTSTLAASPLANLAALAHAGAQVTNLGHVTTAGQSMTKYEVQLSSGVFRARATRIERTLPSWMHPVSHLSGSVTEYVWLDPAGQIAQVTAATTVVSSGHTANVNITLHMSHYGVHVVVMRPPASQVTPLSLAVRGLSRA